MAEVLLASGQIQKGVRFRYENVPLSQWGRIMAVLPTMPRDYTGLWGVVEGWSPVVNTGDFPQPDAQSASIDLYCQQQAFRRFLLEPFDDEYLALYIPKRAPIATGTDWEIWSDR